MLDDLHTTQQINLYEEKYLIMMYFTLIIKTMKFVDLLNLGFAKRSYSDHVHYDEYGFDPFELICPLGKRHMLHWDVLEKDKVRLNKYKSDGYTIEKKWDITDLDTVAKLIEMFG